MKERRGRNGFSLVEVLAIVVVVALTGLFFLQPVGRNNDRRRVRCVNHLKDVGLAFRIFATDNGDRFPAEVMLTNGVPLKSIDALRVFLTLTNVLSTPKILFCPADEKRQGAESFRNLELRNISYFVSLSAGMMLPQLLLAGDRNLETNGVAVPPGLFSLRQGMPLSWSKEIHNERGNIAMGDGSVQQFSSARLKQGLQDQGLGDGMNWLAIP